MPPKRRKNAELAEKQRENDVGDGERFGWLLAPIRDLARNWDIDIGRVLEEYLAELGHQPIDDPDNNPAKMNFAEAALLIQGSTSVYSKKVEYLYELCCQLNRVFSQRRSVANQQPLQNVAADGNEHHSDTSSLLEPAVDFADDFAPLDDIPVMENVDLNENDHDVDNFANAAARFRLVCPPMPLSLLPLEECEKSSLPLISATGQVIGRRDDFWINRAKIHPATGALLLDSANASLINALMTPNTFASCGIGHLDLHLLSPIGPGNNRFRDTRKGPDQSSGEPAGNGEISLRDDDDAFSDYDQANHFDPIMQTALTVAVPPPLADGNELFGIFQTPRVKKKKTKHETVREILENPWKEFDWGDDDNDDEDSGLRVNPFVKGNTHRIPNFIWRTGEDVAMLAQGVSDFLNDSLTKKSRRVPKEDWKRPSWPAFDDIFWQEIKRRMQLQQQRSIAIKEENEMGKAPRKRKRGQSELDAENEERERNISRNLHVIFDDPVANDDEEAEDEDDAGEGNDVDPPCDQGGVQDDMSDDDIVIPGWDHDARESTATKRRPQAGFNDSDHSESPVYPETYEDVVRSRLEELMREKERTVTETDLSRRVDEWTKKMKSVFEEEESRPQFDIGRYSADVLAFFDQSTSNGSYYFADLAEKKPSWDVSRYLVSTLVLANSNSVGLSTLGQPGTSESIDTLKLQLISSEIRNDQIDQRMEEAMDAEEAGNRDEQ